MNQFQRRIASEEHKATGKVFRSKAAASPSLQNLVLRKEIRLYGTLSIPTLSLSSFR